MTKAILVWYFLLLGLCFGSFGLAAAWRIKHRRKFGGRSRSVCERCKHTLAASDLIPLFSWLFLAGRCRYCQAKLSLGLPLAELTGGVTLAASYWFWPDSFMGAVNIARFGLWVLVIILFLVLFFYDLQWYKLPNKVMYPLWLVTAVDFGLRFVQKPGLNTLLNGIVAVAVSGGLFWLIWRLSSGKWIGYGDVRLGLAIGLLLATPGLAGLALFGASLIGIIVFLPSIATGGRKLASKVPFGPLLIAATVITRLAGPALIRWYLGRLGL